MNKHTLLFVLLLTTATLNAQILYRISGNGLRDASFIVGTHHLTDESFVQKIPGIQMAMNQTAQVCGEVRMADMSNPDTMEFVQKAILLPKNKTIRDVLLPEYYNRLNELFANTMGLPFDDPQIFESMGRYNPTTLTTTIISFMYFKNHQGEFNPTKGMDSYFQTEAVKAGKQVKGLESVAFQTNLLYSAPLKEGVAALQCLLDNQDYTTASLEALTTAYRNMDIKAIEQAMSMKYGNECDKTDNKEDELINQRNANWIKQMPKIMTGSPTLFVIGAGHLFGEKGILNLLRQAGYHVEPVTE